MKIDFMTRLWRFRLEIARKTDRIPLPSMNIAPSNTENTSSPEDLEKYAESVRLRIRMKKSELFPNRSSKHARIILEEFIKAAESSIRIYCGKLNKAVYSGLKDAFVGALSRHVSIQVMTSCTAGDIESTDLAKWLVTGGCSLPAREDMLRAGSKYPDFPHFAIIDSKMYRLEVDEQKKQAIVCAYDEGDTSSGTSIAARLTGLFPTLWNEGTPVKISEDGTLC